MNILCCSLQKSSTLPERNDHNRIWKALVTSTPENAWKFSASQIPQPEAKWMSEWTSSTSTECAPQAYIWTIASLQVHLVLPWFQPNTVIIWHNESIEFQFCTRAIEVVMLVNISAAGIWWRLQQQTTTMKCLMRESCHNILLIRIYLNALSLRWLALHKSFTIITFTTDTVNRIDTFAL